MGFPVFLDCHLDGSFPPRMPAYRPIASAEGLQKARRLQIFMEIGQEARREGSEAGNGVPYWATGRVRGRCGASELDRAGLSLHWRPRRADEGPCLYDPGNRIPKPRGEAGTYGVRLSEIVRSSQGTCVADKPFDASRFAPVDHARLTVFREMTRRVERKVGEPA